MVQHLVEGDGLRGIVTKLDHADAVATEEHVDARELHVHRGRVVVRRHHRNRLRGMVQHTQALTSVTACDASPRRTSEARRIRSSSIAVTFFLEGAADALNERRSAAVAPTRSRLVAIAKEFIGQSTSCDLLVHAYREEHAYREVDTRFRALRTQQSADRRVFRTLFVLSRVPVVLVL